MDDRHMAEIIRSWAREREVVPDEEEKRALSKAVSLYQTAVEGGTVNLELATFTDGGSGDTHTATINWGGLWNGTQRSVSATATVQPSAQWRVTVGLQRTAGTLQLPGQSFVSSIVTMRTNYSFTTNMFLDALVQYNRDRRQINTNIRFNFIHRPLSDLYVVYNEQRFTTESAPPGRGVIVKFSQMFPF